MVRGQRESMRAVAAAGAGEGPPRVAASSNGEDGNVARRLVTEGAGIPFAPRNLVLPRSRRPTPKRMRERQPQQYGVSREIVKEGRRAKVQAL